VGYLKLLRQSKAGRRESDRRDEVRRDPPEPRRGETEARAAHPVSSADYQRLEEAGYGPKVSFFGRVLWERPDTGFYVSQEMALHLLDTKNVRN
jgi:hypothetical protein